MRQRLIQAVVFDFDGTLVDSDPIKRSGFYEATADVPGSASALDKILSNPDAGDRYQVFATLAMRLNQNPAQADNWAAMYGRLCEHHIPRMLDRSGVVHFLLRLKSDGYALFIASATPRIDLVALIAKSALASIFASIYGQPMSKIESLRQIMNDNAWSPDQIVMVGNDESDRLAAEMAACRFIGVGPDSTAFDIPVSILVNDTTNIAAHIEKFSLV